MDKMTGKIILAFLVILIAAAAVLGGFYLMNKQGTKSKGNLLPGTEVEKLKAKDLELKYPGTPTEVVKLYWRLNKCMYNTKKISDEDLKALLNQLRMMYDREFLENKGNSFDEMLESFQGSREEFLSQGRFISSYIVEEDNKVVYDKLKGRECAKLNVNVLESVSSNKTTRTAETFMCRKDADGKWKILGWQLADDAGAKE